MNAPLLIEYMLLKAPTGHAVAFHYDRTTGETVVVRFGPDGNLIAGKSTETLPTLEAAKVMAFDLMHPSDLAVIPFVHHCGGLPAGKVTR